VYVSQSTQMNFATFGDIGPTFYQMSPQLFVKNDDGSYSVVDEFESTIATYFDNQFGGVHTDYFDGATSKFKLTLTDEGLNVSTGYTASGIDYSINFELKDIGSTVLPDFYLNS